MSKAECERRLRPEFSARGVASWDLHSSELCAGGELGVDACGGEGGAPLVCLDEVIDISSVSKFQWLFMQGSDQYYAVGLVGYGLGCKDAIPAVYTNLAEPSIKSFIKEAIGNSNYC